MSAEVTNQSYFDRMQSACCGVCVGLLLFFGSWGVLFWNEGRAVKRQQDLDEGRGILQQVGLTTINATIDKGLDNKLVYVKGTVDGGNATIYDDLFKIDVTNATNGAIKYERSTEMYQWKEETSTRTEKTSLGGERTIKSFSYTKVWSSTLISSSSFKETQIPANPTNFLVPGFVATSDDIGLGPYRLSIDISNQVSWETIWTDVPVNTNDLNFTGYTTTSSQGQVNLRKTANIDTVGDNMVTFSVVLPDDVSVIAKQGSGGVLEPYITEGDRELLLFSRGDLSVEELFKQAEEDNNLWTWILRFVGFLCMVFGISLMLNPIATAFDVLPFCGDALEGCIGGCIIPCIALCISVPLSLMIISIAWIFYRPEYAIGTLVMLGLLVFLYINYFKPKLSEAPSQSGASAEKPNQSFNENFREQEATAVPVIPASPYGGEKQQKTEAVPFGQALDNPPPANSGGYSAP